MTQTPPSETAASSTETTQPVEQENLNPQSQPSYVKLAMRNMVRKKSTSLTHFALTSVGLLVILVGLAYLTR